jgi:hypothetical protein
VEIGAQVARLNADFLQLKSAPPPTSVEVAELRESVRGLIVLLSQSFASGRAAA